MTKTSAVVFFKQVKQELTKVTWPTRKEAWTATLMIFVIAAISSLFFLLVDFVVYRGIQLILNFGV